MKITLNVSGGIMGKIEEYPTIDVETLPAHIRDHLIELVESIDFFNLPEKLYNVRGSDMIYETLTIEDQGHVHRVSDTSSPYPTEEQKDFGVLVDYVMGVYKILGQKPATNKK